jgi:hypothetical protein
LPLIGKTSNKNVTFKVWKLWISKWLVCTHIMTYRVVMFYHKERLLPQGTTEVPCSGTRVFFMALQPPVGQGLLIIEASRSHSDTPHSVQLLCTGDQPDAETPTWQHTTLTTERETSTPAAGFEPAIPASKRLHTHALDRAATGIGRITSLGSEILKTKVEWAHLST